MLSLDQQNLLREKYRLSHPEWQPATELFATLVRHYLKPNSHILDLGCGRGGLVEQLDHPLHHIVGADPDLHSLEEHRLALPRIVTFSDHLPLADNSFDLIFSSWLLEHLEQPYRTFVSISRVLRPGGFFVFITPNGRHPLALLNRAFGRLGRLQGYLVENLYGRSHTDTFPTYYRANTSTDLERLGQENGLLLNQLYMIPDPTYLAFTPGLFRLMSWFETHLPQDRHLHIVGVYTH